MLGRNEHLEAITDPEAQIRQVFRNVEAVLTEAGCGWPDVFELTGYFTDIRAHFDLFINVRSAFINEPHPAMTMIGIAELAHPDLICELKGIALFPNA